MASPPCRFLLLLSFILSFSAASAFNITKILERHPGFGAFNSYLTQTQLADEINRRQTITVLAVDDGAVSAVSGQPLDVIKKVLSVHVILDYYDVDKLQNMHKKSALFTTLFQSTGLALGKMGFLNVTVSANGVDIGSAVPGAGLNSRLVEAVAAQPYNISVLHVSSVIVPPGIENTNQTAVPPPPPTPPAAAPKLAQSPKSSPAPVAPGKAAAPSPAVVASPPAPAAPADAPAEETDEPTAPDAAPAVAPATAADGPSSDVSSDEQGAAPGPAEPSDATRVVHGVAAAAVLFVSCLLS